MIDRNEFDGRVACKNVGIVTTLATSVHEIVDNIADGVVFDNILQVSNDIFVDIVLIDDGICILSCAADVRLFVILYVIFNDIGDDTIDISDVIDTDVRVFADGVSDNDPVAILLPLRDISIDIERGDVSIKHCITTFVICIDDDVRI